MQRQHRKQDVNLAKPVYLGFYILQPVIVQNGQHHVSVASQTLYMTCRLHSDANAMLGCFAAYPCPE